MKRVLLVDDNKMILRGLQNIIAWNEAGYRLNGCAHHGEEALKHLEENRADILITDIRMPVMDGLELIRNLKDRKYDIKMIILSSYQDFPLVKEAFKLGASDYLLKTELSPENLINSLSKVSEEQDQEWASRCLAKEQQERMRQQLEKLQSKGILVNRHRRLLKDKMLNELVHGHLTEDLLEAYQRENITLRGQGHYCAFMFLHNNNFQQKMETEWEQDEHLYSFAILNILDELLEESDCGDAYYCSNGEFGILFSGASEEKFGRLEFYTGLFQRITTCLKEHLSADFSGGMSLNAGDDTIAVRELKTMAEEACSRHIIEGGGKLYYGKSLSSTAKAENIKNFERIEYFKNILASLNPQRILDGEKVLKLDPERVQVSQYEEAAKLYQRYAWILEDFARKNGFIDSALEDKINFFHEQMDKASIAEYNGWISETLKTLANTLGSGNSMIRKALQYIRHHFRDCELSIQAVSDELQLNASYLGKLFLREMGSSFSDYVNNIRIEKAKELLLTTNLKVYEICEEIGYTSTDHFSRVFRKYAGVSPKEFSSGKSQ